VESPPTPIVARSLLREAHVQALVRVVARTAAQLSIYRPEAGAVLAWDLRQEVSADSSA